MLTMILADVADREAADAVCKLIASNGISAAVYTEQSRFPPDVAFAGAVVILCSSTSMQSTWLQRHAQTADELGKPMVLVAVRGLDTDELGDATYIWIDDREGLIAQVRNASARRPRAQPHAPSYEQATPAPFDPAPAAKKPRSAREESTNIEDAFEELFELARKSGSDAPAAAPSPSAAPVPDPFAAASPAPIPSPAPMLPPSATPTPAVPPPSPSPAADSAAIGLSLADLTRLRGTIIANPQAGQPQGNAVPPAPSAPRSETMTGGLPAGAPAPLPAPGMWTEARTPPQPAAKSSGAGLVLSGLALAIAAGGAAYYFRDQFADAVQVAARNAEKLLALLGFIKGMPPPLPGLDRPTAAQADLVDCSVFAPPTVLRGDRFMVQVYLHLIDQTDRVAFLAATMDEDARLKGRQTLQVPIARDARVRVELDGQGVKVDEPIQEIVWRGEPNVAAFSCAIPPDGTEATFHPVVRLFVDEMPVGRVLFQVKTTPAATRGGPAPRSRHAGLGARKYRRAFLSYASHDRVEVLKRAQALKVANIDFFQDLLSLQPGERYESQIYEGIAEADLFMLFWSRHARESHWVAKEIDFARECQARNPNALPDIIPVVLDDPRDAPPPERLGDQHFNDTIAALISYEERRPKGTGGFLSRWFGRG